MKEEPSVKLFADVGMGEIFMARLMHLRDHVLSGFGMREINIDWRKVGDGLFTVIFDGLVPAFSDLRALRTEWNDPNVPELKKLQTLKSAFGNLVIAFKDRFQGTVLGMGYSIGFLFEDESKFEKGLKNFTATYPDIHPDFINVLREDRTWLKNIIDVRNIIIEHRSGKPEAKIEELKPYLTPNNAAMLFDNCWRAIEDYFLVFTKNLVDPKYGMELLELHEYQQNKNHHQRVGWFIKPDRLIQSQ